MLIAGIFNLTIRIEKWGISMDDTPDRASKYQADSLSLIGAVALGTGVMIGAGIFALTGIAT